jgi:GNAT superfamily N-acetyltransferase
MDLWVRSGSLDDCVKVAALELAARRDTYDGLVPMPALEAVTLERTARRWRDFLAGEDELARLVIGEDATGASIAFGAAGAPREGALGWDAEIHGLFVLPRARGRHLGRRLLAALAVQLVEAGTSSLGGWALRESEGLRGFYRHLGGRAVGERVTTIGGHSVVEIAFVFDDPHRLAGTVTKGGTGR